MTPRQQLLAALEGILPPVDGQPVDVDAYGRNVDAIDAPTVLVAINNVTPTAELALHYRAYEFELFVLTPYTSPGAADDNLDALLEDVLAALDAAPELRWTNAVRGTYQDVMPAYVVTVPVYTKHDAP